MDPEMKATLIGAGLGFVPALIALVPFTIAWYLVHGPVWWSTNYLENLPWAVFYGVLYIATVKGMDLAAGWYLDRR